MEAVLDKAADGRSKSQTSSTVDLTDQRYLGQPSKANSKHLGLTYSRRSRKARKMGKGKPPNDSNWNLQKNDFSTNNSSIVESAETGYGRKENSDASFSGEFLVVNQTQNGSVKEGAQVDDSAGRVSNDNVSHKVNIFGSESIEKAKQRCRKKTKKGKVRLVSKELSGSLETENIDSVKKMALHPHIPPKSEMKEKNDANQAMSTKQESNGFRGSAAISTLKKKDVSQSPKYNLRPPELKHTYTKRHKKAGQLEEDSHHNSYLNTQLRENDLCNKSLSTMNVAEVGCEKHENDTSFNKNFSHMDPKCGRSSMKNMQASPTSLNSHDISSNFHEVNKVRRRRKKKNKTPICSNPVSTSEKEVSGSMKSDIIDSVEKSDSYGEICSNSEMRNAESNSEKARKRTKRAKEKTQTIRRDDSLIGAQLCDAFPKPSEPGNEDLCQLTCEAFIEEKSDKKDEERHSYSSVKHFTDDIASGATTKKDITLDGISMTLQRASLSCANKKLLILDLNGLLVDVVNECQTFQRAPIRVAGKSVYKRPYCDEFLEFCFERYDIGVWSSRKRKNINVIVDFIFGERRSQLLFCWDLSMCTPTGFNTIENVHKPLVLKELKKLWNKEDQDLQWEKGLYSPSNTLLIDDSPYKALCNPPHTAIFPIPYNHRNENDNALGLEGDLRVYLEGLAMANDIQSYVREHPFGQHAIAPGNQSWGSYLRIIEKMNPSFTAVGNC